MKKLITTIVSGLLVLTTAGLVAAAPLTTAPAAAQIQSGLSAARTSDMPHRSTGSLAKQIINIMLYILVILAVIMVIVGGFKYVTSGGDSNKLTSAKNTIIYSVVGIVIAVFSWAIINWVVERLASS